MLAGLLIGGCAEHPANSFDCTMGVGRSDCAPGTAGYKERAEQQEAARSFAAMDDARCRSYGVEPGSQAYVDCRRRATANQ